MSLEYSCGRYGTTSLPDCLYSDLHQQGGRGGPMVSTTMRESRLEKYIRDYIYDKTAETVRLHLKDAISIRHITKKGSVTLAILWANILQHPRNYPSNIYPYTKHYDSATCGDRLLLRADDIVFTLYMATGALIIEGRYVYDWFTRRFKALLDNFDETFKEMWTFIPTPNLDFPEEKERLSFNEPNTETEDYLLMYTKRHGVDDNYDKQVRAHTDDLLVPGVGDLAVQEKYVEGEELEAEVTSLAVCRVVDGFTYLHKVWKSLLNKWLSEAGTKVYLSSPTLDVGRLCEIIRLSLRHKGKGSVEAFYLSYDCDLTNGKNAADVKRKAMTFFDAKQQTFVEYTVLHRILYPSKKMNLRFAAAVKDGKAEVLVTSAGFHGDNFLNECMETAHFLRMDEADFTKLFLQPITDTIVATTY